MDKERRFSPPAVGGSALLVMFAVLCLTVFAMLSLGTARADGRLSEASALAVSAYYEADARAESIFAALRAGELPAGVAQTGDIYSYVCAISETRELRVELRRTTEGWTVLRWREVSTADWQADDSLTLWDGELS